MYNLLPLLYSRPRATARNRKRCPFEEEADKERFERRGRLKRIDIAERQIIGDGATFRSVQRQAMEAIQVGVSPVVTVMPSRSHLCRIQYQESFCPDCSALPKWVKQPTGGRISTRIGTVTLCPLADLKAIFLSEK